MSKILDATDVTSITASIRQRMEGKKPKPRRLKMTSPGAYKKLSNLRVKLMGYREKIVISPRAVSVEITMSKKMEIFDLFLQREIVGVIVGTVWDNIGEVVVLTALFHIDDVECFASFGVCPVAMMNNRQSEGGSEKTKRPKNNRTKFSLDLPDLDFKL